MRLINMQIQWKKQVILIDKFLFKHSGTWCRSVSLNSLANWAKSSFSTDVLFDLNGGAEGDRTPDLYTASVGITPWFCSEIIP